LPREGVDALADGVVSEMGINSQTAIKLDTCLCVLFSISERVVKAQTVLNCVVYFNYIG